MFDTNVVISALVFEGGHLARLRHQWRAHVLIPLICRETAQELIAALAYPRFRLSAQEQEALLADYLPFCEVVHVLPEEASEVTPGAASRTPICRDPDDVKFLALALAGRADCIVTGDKDLLTLNGTEGLSILTPQAFLERLANPGGA